MQSLAAWLAEAAEFAQSLGRVLESAGSPSPLLVGRSLRRRCAAFDLELADVRRTGRAAGASVGDVYLGCIAASLARYHEALGEPIERLPIAIPCGLHGPAMRENHFGALLIAAPLGVGNVARRLRQISRVMRTGRRERAIDTMGLMAPVLARLPDSMLRALAASVPRPDILAGSLLGPARPAYVAGAKILKSYTFGPAPGVAAMFTLQSLGRGSSISINYDPAAITRSDLFAQCLTRGFSETLRFGGRKPRLGPVVVGTMRDQEMAA